MNTDTLVSPVAKRLDYTATADVQTAIRAMGRTEDIILSPDGSRLGIAAFVENKVFIYSIQITRELGEPRIELSDVRVMTSDAMKDPHGMAFLGNDHIIVCNRSAHVSVFRIPETTGSDHLNTVESVATIEGQSLLWAKVKTPGSVTVYETGEHQYRVLVSNDSWHFISAHQITLGTATRIKHEGVLIEKGLKIPDGVSLSPDQQWIAVSNNVDGKILMFRNTPDLNRKTNAQAVLEGVVCPHGLDFDAEGNLYVADAASPYVHIFLRPESGWQGHHTVTQRIQIMDRETFYKGRHASREGGAKGLHIHKSTGVMMTTHKLGDLEFRDLQQAFAEPAAVDEEELQLLHQSRNDGFGGSKVLFKRSWTVEQRLRNELGMLKIKWFNRDRDQAIQAEQQRYHQQNQTSQDSILDASGPVVSMSTHPQRIETAYLAIESIAAGTQKPGRMLLWVTGDPPIPQTLKHLQARGLELFSATDHGPHTKYYPYLQASISPQTKSTADPPSDPSIPGWVTADDDTFYPSTWLASLLKAAQAKPDAIHCFQPRRMRLHRYHFLPYQDWPTTDASVPAPLNFLTTSTGVFYPLRFLDCIRERGTSFLDQSPTSDDIWLSALAYHQGIHILPVDDGTTPLNPIPGTNEDCLSLHNIAFGAAQIQLANVFTPEDRSHLYNAQMSA